MKGDPMLTAKLITYYAGYLYEAERVQAFLQLGEEYPVYEINVYSWCSDVFLEGFEESFNSIFFEFYLDGKYIDFNELIWMDNGPSCIHNTYK